MLASLYASLPLNPATVDVRVEHGRFLARSLHLGPQDVIRFVNSDRETYTVESPGLMSGDVTLSPGATVEVKPLYEAGSYTIMIEEVPTSEIVVDYDGRPVEDPSRREPPFDVARRNDRQPLLSEPGQEPAYGAYATFDFAARGEAGRQSTLQALYRLQEELSGDAPPPELAAYLTPEGWTRLRPSVSLVVGLGSSAYDARRFGTRVAASRPKALHPFSLGARLRAAMPPERDVVLRVVSDNHWFNLRVCRLALDRLRGRTASPAIQAGYAPPRGRSPILGGFFDGIGNPTGADRERTVYAGSNGTYLALFRIGFDEIRFERLGLTAQEALVGRRKGSGHQVAGGSPAAHRARAQNDGKSLIVRMPLVYDEGVGRTGLLFASVQASIDRQFERILQGFMLARDAKKRQDGLLSFMRFESGAYYYVPPSPRGSYPGTLRGH